MIFPDFDPYVFGLHWNGFGIRWYALAYVAGILLGWAYVTRLARNEALWGPRAPVATRDQIDDLVLWITLGVIVGGRLGSVLFYNASMIWERPLEIVQIWKGGMSFHGGLIGVILAMVFYARAQKIDVLKISDLVAPAVPIGLFFGRLANFVNGELWGRETDVPWAFIVDGRRVHPSQLYEAALEGVLLFVILFFVTHKAGLLKKRGGATGVFLAGYGLFRMLVETVRAPDKGLDDWPLGLTMGMVLSLPMLVGGLWLIWRAFKAEPAVLEAAPAAAAAPVVRSEPVAPPERTVVAEAAPDTKSASPAAKAARKAPTKPKAAATSSSPAAKPTTTKRAPAKAAAKSRAAGPAKAKPKPKPAS